MTFSLKPGEDYIDHCVSTVADIDPESFAQRELGELVGRNYRAFVGRATLFFALGSSDTRHGTLHIGLKDDDCPPEYRLVTEMRDIAYLVTKAPELLPKFPYFLGLLAVEGGHRAIGLLTEDASRGGEVEVLETRMSEETFNTIANTTDLRLDLDTTELHTTFDVAGSERILDMAPSIFGLSVGYSMREDDVLSALYEKASDHEEQLTVWIPEQSPLACSIAEQLAA